MFVCALATIYFGKEARINLFIPLAAFAFTNMLAVPLVWGRCTAPKGGKAMKQRVTIKDIAARAGVSYGTVSRALSDSPEIGKATKQRIRDLCKEMGYTPNLVARSLVTRHTKVIGLLVPDVSNPFFSEIAREIEITARAHGYQLLVCSSMRSAELEYTAAERMLRQQVDGLIISACTQESMERLQGVCGTLPVVYLGDNHASKCCYVAGDNVHGGYIGGQYLTLLGHRRIAFLGGRANSATNCTRVEGFYKAMREAGAQPVVMECPSNLDHTVRYDVLARQFFAGKPDVTAVFAYSDRFALGVMQAADEQGVRIPEDLSLLGYDNTSYAALPCINLTTISHHKRRLGRQATMRLLARIGGDLGEYHDVQEPTLIVRGTCQSISSE